VNIRRVEETDFRRCDIRIFTEFRNNNAGFVKKLAKDDIVVFISKQRNQMLFIHGFTEFFAADGSSIREALQSIRHRIVGGAWNPLMLKNYAEEAGLQIEGLSRFEDHFKHLVENDNGKQGRSRGK